MPFFEFLASLCSSRLFSPARNRCRWAGLGLLFLPFLLPPALYAQDAPTALSFSGVAPATFAPPETIGLAPAIDPPFAPVNARRVLTLDFDGDGDTDIVAAAYDVVYAFQNGGDDQGGGTGSTWTRSLIAQQDQDSEVDNALEGPIGDLDVADTNGDGVSDLFFIDVDTGSGDAEVWTFRYAPGGWEGFTLNSGLGSTFTASLRSGVRRIIKGAFVNGDAQADVIYAAREFDRFSSLENNGTNGLADRSRWPGQTLYFGGDEVKNIGAGDLDGNGSVDVVFESDQGFGSDDATRYYASFNPRNRAETDWTHQRIEIDVIGAPFVADFDGDGDPDVFAGDLTADAPNQPALLRNEGSGTNWSSVPFPDYVVDQELFGVWGGGDVGDLNGDGEPDVALVGQTATGSDRRYRFGAYLNDGSGTFYERPLLPTPSVTNGTSFDPGDVAIGDVNGDGTADLVAVWGYEAGSDEGAAAAWFPGAVLDHTVTDGSPAGLDFSAAVTPGTADNPIGLFALTVPGTGGSLSSVTVTNSAPGVEGLTAARLYRSTDATFDLDTFNPDEILLAETSIDPTGAPKRLTFSGFEAFLDDRSSYFFVAVDVESDAPPSEVRLSLDVPADLTVNGTSLAEVNGTAASSFAALPLSNGDATLPVEMAGLSAAAVDDGSVQLEWVTATETGNAGFIVERRTEDGNEVPIDAAWTDVGFVEGAGTTVSPRRYRFTDAGLPFSAETVTYRLRQVDVDGTAVVAGEVTTRVRPPSAVRLHGAFPSPARGPVTVRYELDRRTAVHLQVYDVLGRRVRAQHVSTQPAGRHEAVLSTAGLSPGTYFLRLLAGDAVHTTRLSVLR